MAFVPFTNTAKAVIAYGIGTLPNMTNTLYFDLAGFDTIDMANLAAAVQAWFCDNVLPHLSDKTAYKSVTVYDMRASDGEVVVEESRSGELGTALGDASAPSNCVVITLRTNARGRSGRGRNYVAGISEGVISSRVLDATFTANIAAAYDSLVTGLPALSWVLVVASRQSNNVPLATGVTRVVTDAEVRNLVTGSQRRRNHRS